jgi:signal transduction histidine kinase
MKFNDLIKDNRHDGTNAAVEAVGTDRRLQNLETILNVVRMTNASLVLSDLLELVIDQAIRITNAERGFLMLADDNRNLQFVVGRDGEGHPIHPENFQVSSSVLEDVFVTGESICIESALTDERFERRQSVQDLELQTIMCAPLETHEKTIGVIYVDSRHIQAIDKEDILYLFEILAGQAAIAIRNARLYEDLKKTYEQLKQANEQIIKSEKMALRGELVAEVSHELKNLITIILLQLHALQKRTSDGETQQATDLVSEIIQSVHKISSFSENLLVRSSITPKMKKEDLNKLVSDFVAFISVLPKFRKAKVVMEGDQTLPRVSVDKEQLQHVLLNLSNNAAESFPEATIKLKTEYNILKNLVYLSVSDNGKGLDPRIKGKILVEKVTTKENGHGYGLSICRKIIESHGGRITVESEPCKGTVFTMTFPPADIRPSKV